MPEQKEKLVQINKEERLEKSRFIDRIKKRWDAHYLFTNHTAKNLSNYSRGFVDKGYTQRSEKKINSSSQPTSATLWTTDLEVKLLETKDQARKKGKGFI